MREKKMVNIQKTFTAKFTAKPMSKRQAKLIYGLLSKPDPLDPPPLVCIFTKKFEPPVTVKKGQCVKITGPAFVYDQDGNFIGFS